GGSLPRAGGWPDIGNHLAPGGRQHKPITPPYPRLSIDEPPSVSHSVTPAPTSVTAFVGYTHPLKTAAFGQAVQLFSFADYQANFGGFFSHPLLPDYVGKAV